MAINKHSHLERRLVHSKSREKMFSAEMLWLLAEQTLNWGCQERSEERGRTEDVEGRCREQVVGNTGQHNAGVSVLSERLYELNK